MKMLLGGQEVRQIDLTIPVRAQLPAGTDELDEETNHVTFSENATSLKSIELSRQMTRWKNQSQEGQGN